MENKLKKTLVGLVVLATLSSPVRCEGKSLWYHFVTSPAKTKKAEKALAEYSSDGVLTDYEKSKVLGIINNKKIRRGISLIDRSLRIEAERRRREEEKRKTALAKQAYKRAADARKHNDYHSARSNINEALEHKPNHLGYKIYKDYINGSEKAKEDFKEIKREVGGGLRRAGGWLEGKLYKLKRKLRR